MIRRKLSSKSHARPGKYLKHSTLYGRGSKVASTSPSIVETGLKLAASAVGVSNPVIAAVTAAGKLIPAIENAYSSKAATSLKNQFMTGAKAFQGETHALLKKPEGGMRLANFAGPGTKIIERLKRGDQPISPVDQTAEAHDIRYTLARTSRDVRAADQKLLDRIAEMKKKNIDSPFNRTAVGTPIIAKMKLEDIGLRDPLKNVDLNAVISPSDRQLLEEKLGQLTQKGEGPPPLPGMALQDAVAAASNNNNTHANTAAHSTHVVTDPTPAVIFNHPSPIPGLKPKKRKAMSSKTPKIPKLPCKKPRVYKKRKQTGSGTELSGAGTELSGAGLKLAGA